MATMTLDELVTQLRGAYGAALRSVVLYGSAAAGEHNPKRSDYNVLVIVESLGADALRAAAATTRAWSESGNPAPLTMTMTEWRRSSDIFAMEYADILDRHRVLHGAPPFDGITVDPRDLRLQLEREAMGKLLKLRGGLLAAGNDPRAHLELLSRSASTIMVLFRAVLRLHGRRPSADNLAVSTETAQLAGLDPTPFERVVRHLRGERPIAPAEAGEVLAGYVAGVERLVAHLDQFAPPDHDGTQTSSTT